jgi:magnesium-transporting ATPase (P-type)
VENTGLAAARTVVVNVVVLVQILYLFNCRTLKHPALSLGLFTNRWVIAGALTMLAAQIAFTHVPVLNQLFHSAPISGGAWLRVIAAAVIVFLAVEFEKWLRFHRKR